MIRVVDTMEAECAFRGQARRRESECFDRLAIGTDRDAYQVSHMRFWSHSRFTILLAVLVVLNLTKVATIGHLQNPLLLNLLAAVFLIAATLSLCVESRSRTIALVLGIPAIGLSLSRNLFSANEEHVVLVLAHATSMLFLAFIIFIVLQTLMTQPAVTTDSIAGAFCGYVLIGVMFAEVYCLLEVSVPNSFQMDMALPHWADEAPRRWLALEYFSLTTLTTLGFGDVIPITPMARGLAVWEAICGQFYLAVLVAGLVNLRASRTPDI